MFRRGIHYDICSLKKGLLLRYINAENVVEGLHCIPRIVIDTPAGSFISKI